MEERRLASTLSKKEFPIQSEAKKEKAVNEVKGLFKKFEKLMTSPDKKQNAISTYNKAVKRATSSGMSNSEILEIHNSVKKPIAPKKTTGVTKKPVTKETKISSSKGKKPTKPSKPAKETEKKPPLIERKNTPERLKNWKINKLKKENKG